MPVLNLAVGDLAGLFLRLMPCGPVWPKLQGALQPQAVAALMPAYQRLIERDNNLLVDSFPSTAVESLPEWEYTLGLPDPCAGEDQTVAQRQAHVVARLTQSNGPSIPSLTAFAATLGYPITITEFAPARYGSHKIGQPIRGKAWAHAWRITTVSTNIVPARYGKHRIGEPYRTWGGTVLECEMDRLKPAHTVLTFAFTGPALATN